MKCFEAVLVLGFFLKQLMYENAQMVIQFIGTCFSEKCYFNKLTILPKFWLFYQYEVR